MSENSKCEAHSRVKTGGFCPVCLINERDRLRDERDHYRENVIPDLQAQLDQERQRREQAEGLLREARPCLLDDKRVGNLCHRIDDHFGGWDG